MFWCLNTTKLDHEYTIDDLKELKRLQDYGLDSDFYGGRVQYIGTTDSDVLLLIENRDGLKVIDTAAETLDNLPHRILTQLVRRKKVPIEGKPSKAELLEMLQPA